MIIWPNLQLVARNPSNRLHWCEITIVANISTQWAVYEITFSRFTIENFWFRLYLGYLSPHTGSSVYSIQTATITYQSCENIGESYFERKCNNNYLQKCWGNSSTINMFNLSASMEILTKIQLHETSILLSHIHVTIEDNWITKL